MILPSPPGPVQPRSDVARFLIVDDDPVLLEGLTGALQLRLFQVSIDICQSPTDAIDRLKNGSHYDVVITDLTMPAVNGLTILQEGRALAPNTSFVLITAQNSAHLVDQAKALGAEDILLKPFEREQLIKTAKAILKRRRAR